MNESGIFTKLVIDDFGDIFLLYVDPMHVKPEIVEKMIPKKADPFLHNYCSNIFAYKFPKKFQNQF